jgi:uncharacterized protein (UPF0262 family)
MSLNLAKWPADCGLPPRGRRSGPLSGRQVLTVAARGCYQQPEGAAGGPYDLKIALAENRLALRITSPDSGFDQIHLLSLSPFRGVIRDYFMVCESYYQAIRNATPAQIEALDMGRRGLHNEGSSLLQARLEGKVKTDLDTARRLFTLVCALHWRG